jgi:hypothetical protein
VAPGTISICFCNQIGRRASEAIFKDKQARKGSNQRAQLPPSQQNTLDPRPISARLAHSPVSLFQTARLRILHPHPPTTTTNLRRRSTCLSLSTSCESFLSLLQIRFVDVRRRITVCEVSDVHSLLVIISILLLYLPPP